MEPQIRNWEIAGRDPVTGKFILRQVDEMLFDPVNDHIKNYLNKAGGFCTVGQLSNILREHGYQIGRNKLYWLLETNGVIRRFGDEGYIFNSAFERDGYGITIDLDLRDYGKRYGTDDDLEHMQPLFTCKGCLKVREIIEKNNL